jgi:hypothetical protein
MRTHHKPLDQGFALWQPDLGWLKIANAQLHHSFVAITGEWQAFVGRRVQEDLRLWEELAGAKAQQNYGRPIQNSGRRPLRIIGMSI